MCYDFVFRFAPRSPRDSPRVSNLPQRLSPNVSRRMKLCLSYPPTSPGHLQAPNVSRQPQDLFQTSASAFQELRQGPEPIEEYAHSPHLVPTCTHGPRLQGQGQRSQVKGPGFIARSAGPRRVCSLMTETRRFTACFRNEYKKQPQLKTSGRASNVALSCCAPGLLLRW